MKIRFLITAAIAAISISVFAQKPPAGGPPGGPPGQRGGPGGMRRGGMPEELKKQLALTPAQETKMKAINDKYREKFRAMGGGKPASGQRPDFAKMKPLMDARQKEVDAILTPKQREIMKKWRAAHPPRMGGPGGGATAAGPGKGPKAGGKQGG